MSYTLYLPQTLEEAFEIYGRTGGQWLAGGTVLQVNIGRGTESPDVLISLERLEALKEVRETEDELVIGALVNCDDLENCDTVRKDFYALWQAASQVGGPQIRHRATIGGNLAAASPSSDLATPLLAYDAHMLVQGPDGVRKVPVRELFLGRFRTSLKSGELILSVILKKDSGMRSGFVKVGKRNALSVSCLNMAYVKWADGSVDVSVGAAAPRAVWCGETSAILSKMTGEAAHAAAGSAENMIPGAAGSVENLYVDKATEVLQSEISPIDDRWGTAEYRRTVAANLLRRFAKYPEVTLK